MHRKIKMTCIIIWFVIKTFSISLCSVILLVCTSSTRSSAHSGEELEIWCNIIKKQVEGPTLPFHMRCC